MLNKDFYFLFITEFSKKVLRQQRRTFRYCISTIHLRTIIQIIGKVRPSPEFLRIEQVPVICTVDHACYYVLEIGHVIWHVVWITSFGRRERVVLRQVWVLVKQFSFRAIFVRLLSAILRGCATTTTTATWRGFGSSTRRKSVSRGLWTRSEKANVLKVIQTKAYF